MLLWSLVVVIFLGIAMLLGKELFLDKVESIFGSGLAGLDKSFTQKKRPMVGIITANIPMILSMKSAIKFSIATYLDA